jgi:hypothetical protein
MSQSYENRRHAVALALAGLMIVGASAAQAAMAPPPAAGYAGADTRFVAGGCGAGRHRLLTGGCSLRPFNKTQADYLRDLRPCQPGTHSVSFPTTQGYRCVLNR